MKNNMVVQKSVNVIDSTIVERIENGSILLRDTKNIKAKEFVNILSEMVANHNKSA